MTYPPGGPRRGPFSLPAWSHRGPADAVPLVAPAADPSAFVADTDDPAAGSPGTALPRLLSIGDVAQVFDRSARTLRRWIRLGHLVPVRVGGALFFDPDDIRRLIAGRLCAPCWRAERCRKPLLTGGRARQKGRRPAPGFCHLNH
jgi:hypothetical protein